MIRKLTRQERKEALAEYDKIIAKAETLFDGDQDKLYADIVEGTQRSRAARLAELEGSAK